MPQEINYHTIPLFRGLSRIDLARLIPSLIEVSLADGNVIFRQGDAGEALYIIVSGEVLIRRADEGGAEHEITRLHSGGCFGEMALLSGASRSADVIAEGDVRLLKLSKLRFQQLLNRHPSFSLFFAGLLARRVDPRITDAEPDLPNVMFHSQPIRIRQAGFITHGIFSLVRLARGRTTGGILLTSAVCGIAYAYMAWLGVKPSYRILNELMLGATVLWSLDILNYHAVAVALPILAVIFGSALSSQAFSGFSSPSWFLVLGVFALSAAVSRTGLMYRLVLSFLRRFPPHFSGQAFALAVTGLVMTPIIPSSNGRAALSGPLVQALSETMRMRAGSRGALGLAMAALLGFGHMSSLFMNGTATCLFALGLLPPDVATGVTWGGWFKAALVLGMSSFILTFLAIPYFYRPLRNRAMASEVINAQIMTLGEMTRGEKVSLLTIVVTLTGFLTQSWHGINAAWVSMLGLLMLVFGGVLDEKGLRAEIDWNFLLSFGSLVGFGGVISSSGLSTAIARTVQPAVSVFGATPYLFLPMVSVVMHLLRFALPLPAAILVAMLTVQPVSSTLGIHPLVVALVVLVSGNPWFLPYQNSIYLNIVQNCEEGFIRHRQTVRMAWWHVGAVTLSVIVSIPYWRYLGLL